MAEVEDVEPEDGSAEAAVVTTGTCEGGFADGEVPLRVDEEWLRTCAEEHWDDEAKLPSNLMFQLGSNDAGKLSGARASNTSPEAVYTHQAVVEGKPTRGVWSLTTETLMHDDLHVHDDSALLPSPPASPPAHAYLDLRHLPAGRGNPAKAERERVRVFLMSNAVERLRYP